MSKVDPKVPIVLDKPRNLLLDINAMVLFEKATGKNMLRLKTGDLTATDLRAFLWACLKHEDAELKLDQVGQMVHAGNLEEVSRKLEQAWALATPEGGSAEAPLAESPPTG